MTTKPKYSHTAEFTKYGSADIITKSMMALTAFQRVESLTNEIEEATKMYDALEADYEQAKDRIINLEKRKI